MEDVIARQAGQFMRLSERLFAGIEWNDAVRGLERPAFGLLSRIATGGPIRLSALAADIQLDLSTVSRQVAALESRHLVQRAPDPDDRRAVLVEATSKGQDVFRENRERWVGVWRGLLGDWTPEEQQNFAMLLTRLNKSLSEPPDARLNESLSEPLNARLNKSLSEPLKDA